MLKQKIEETSECKVTIPEFGETYDLVGTEPLLLSETKEVREYKKEFKRLDLIERIESLKEDISDFENVIMMKKIQTKDDDLKSLEDRVKEIQKQIQNLIN